MEDVNLESKSLEDLQYIAKMMGVVLGNEYSKEELIEQILISGREALKERRS